MHILVLPSFYPSTVRPMTGIFFKEQAEALARAGYQVGVLVAPRMRETLSTYRQDKQLPSLTREGLPGGIPVYRMHRGWFPRVFPQITAALHRRAAMEAFEAYIKAEGMPDIIHAHNIFYSGYMAAKLGEAYNIPTVLTEHSSNFLRGRVFLSGQHRVAEETLAGIHTISAVSDVLARALKRYMPRRTVYITGNVVNTHLFKAMPAPPLSPFVVSIVGSLIKLKRIELAIEAFARAFPHDEAVLYIGGDGPLRSELEAVAKKHGIGQRVKFYGRLSRQGVRDLFHRSHVVLSASDFETFGITLIEALSCGRPIIATRSGGPQDFVTDEVGILVPKNNSAAMAEALRTIRENYTRYQPQALHDYVEARYSEAAIVQRLTELYEQAQASLG